MFGIAWLESKIAKILLLIGFLLTIILIIRDDIHVRANYEQASNNLIAIEKQQVLEQKLEIEVREKQDENFQTQNKALLEMHEKGYLADPNGDNPDWMCASPTGCYKAESSIESSK